jgi:hypothetical protein
MTPRQVVTEKQPDRVRLTMLDGSRIEITDPMVSDGQIVGHPVHEGRAVRSDSLRVAADSVALVEIRETNATGTELLLVGGVFIASGMVFAAIYKPFP